MKKKQESINKVENVKNYELMVVLKPLLPDDIRKSLHKDLLDQIKEFGGEVVDVDVWGKRYLAYNIKGHNEGYYVVYNFKVGAQNIKEIKRKLGLKTEILRFMISVVEHTEMIGKGIKKKEMDAEI